MSIEKKKIIVFPATGRQGRAACQALSQDPGYEVIGITRSPNGPKSNHGGIDIHSLGITIVKGDFGDPDGYRKYLEGAYGIFINTDMWSLFADTKGDLALTKATEMKYGLDIIAECEKANIKHVVFSGLYASFEVKDDMISTTSYELQAHLRKSKLPWTIYYSSAYWENLHHLGMIQVQDDGSIKINLMSPDSLKQQFTSIRQVGPFVKTIFDHPEKYMGKEVFNNTEEATWGSFATRLAAMSGKKVFTPQITEQEWSSPETKARLFPYYSVLDSLYTTYFKAYYPGTTGVEVVPDMPTFEEWARTDPYMKEVFGI